MKSFLVALAVVVVAATLAPGDAMARRFGGGGGFGMQRSLPRAAPPQAAPARPATPTAQPAQAPANAAATAAAPRRSWLGPVAGLAAGLGLAALMSHLGVGAEFANIIMLLMLGLVAIVAVRFLMRRFAPAGATGAPGAMQFAGGAPSTGAGRMPSFADPGSLAAAPVAPAAGSVPSDFDGESFERIAKMIFIRMQAANDAGDLNDLRNFTTPEVFAAARLELQERGPSMQRTDVVRVDAEVVDATTEADRQIVSVRFHGLVREEIDGVAEPFDELWHLVRPADGSREWAIAGIEHSASSMALAA
ncbi:MAG: Tim44-like domain-containing protein [Caldimonas sp.]